MTNELFRMGLLVGALLIVGFAFVPILRASLEESIRAFIAFFFLLLGLRYIFGSFGGDNILLGDFFASLALTFLWATRRK